ncbi:hypothetical protein JI735_19670 [Paenibacillus sonchi]|uniref:Uncharacterized protein n=1 Tax=Paenibacillus sonchi TaxID=373687 RepID=A0A974P7P5_9BACL|nr:hypothetical protein [Paenibacillus sonchi]MCE3203426.1 hypothetical protein [Paenibacillus sonchi]QQZ58949.1 hypothetical protein JI735_19670 [Paenibacillus sonchi]
MSTTYKVLESDTDFLAAALALSKVSVWYREEPDPIGYLMDYGGIVEGYTAESIKINGAQFVRERFEFRAYIK